MTNNQLELTHKLAIAKLFESKVNLIEDLKFFESVENPDQDMINATNETKEMIAEMTEAIERSSKYTLVE